MKMLDFNKATTVFELFPAQSAGSGANGTGVDVRDYQGVINIVLDVANGGTSTLDMKIQDSADNSSFADVTGLAFTQVSTTASLQTLGVDSRLVRRYIRAVSTIAGTHVFCVLGYGQKGII